MKTILSSKVEQHNLRCFVVSLMVWLRGLSRPSLQFTIVFRLIIFETEKSVREINWKILHREIRLVKN